MCQTRSFLSDFAMWQRGEHDDRMSLRALKVPVTQTMRAPAAALPRLLAPVPTTGSEDWDRVLAASALYIAHMRGVPESLCAWAAVPFPPRRGVFDPAHEPRWFAARYLNTPIEFLERAVCVTYGDLEALM